MQDRETGAIAAFSGIMTNPVTRYAKEILVVADATFTVLDFQFNAAETEQTDPAAFTYPALIELADVKKFQLSSGSIIVTFGHAK